MSPEGNTRPLTGYAARERSTKLDRLERENYSFEGGVILPKRGSIGLRPQGSRPGDSPMLGGGVGAAIRVGFGRPGIASGLSVEPPECPWPRSTTRGRRTPDESATNYLSEVPRLAWFHRGYARATTASAISSSERPVAAARASMISTASSIEQSACTAIISDAWSTLLDICCVVIRTLLPYLEGPDARRGWTTEADPFPPIARSNRVWRSSETSIQHARTRQLS